MEETVFFGSVARFEYITVQDTEKSSQASLNTPTLKATMCESTAKGKLITPISHPRLAKDHQPLGHICPCSSRTEIVPKSRENEEINEGDMGGKEGSLPPLACLVKGKNNYWSITQ